MSGEAAAELIYQARFGSGAAIEDRIRKEDLSESQKQEIAALAGLTGALAGAISASGESQAAGEALTTAKNAVENNYLGLAIVKAAEVKCGDDFTCRQEFTNEAIKAHDEALDTGAKVQGAVVGGALALSVLPEAALIGGTFSGVASMGGQYLFSKDGTISWTDVAIATGVGTITAGYGSGFWATVGWNTASGVAGSLIKGEDAVQGGVVGGVASGVGYGVGKLIQGPFQQWLNPAANKYIHESSKGMLGVLGIMLKNLCLQFLVVGLVLFQQRGLKREPN